MKKRILIRTNYVPTPYYVEIEVKKGTNFETANEGDEKEIKQYRFSKAVPLYEEIECIDLPL